jgi:hypothetical protein
MIKLHKLPGVALLSFLAVVVSLNIAWEHQVILTQQVTLNDYYSFAARAPFIYRILPAMLYRILLVTHVNGITGLKAPLDTYFGVFQLLLDSASLIGTFIFMARIASRLNPLLPARVVILFAGSTELLIVVFGFFMVPNYAVFYPYDFPDMCCAAGIFYLCVSPSSAAKILLPIAVFVATLNKETALFYSGLYLAFSIERRTNWKEVAFVLLASVAGFLLARSFVVMFVTHSGLTTTTGGPQYEYQFVSNTLSQLRNPLLFFALLNICSYLYLGVWVIRKRLDRTDMLILALVIAWILTMSVVGVVRQLRLFVPASVLLYVILARHLAEIVDAMLEGKTRAMTSSARYSLR